jgi:hypothetical protein
MIKTTIVSTIAAVSILIAGSSFKEDNSSPVPPKQDSSLFIDFKQIENSKDFIYKPCPYSPNTPYQLNSLEESSSIESIVHCTKCGLGAIFLKSGSLECSYCLAVL